MAESGIRATEVIQSVSRHVDSGRGRFPYPFTPTINSLRVADTPESGQNWVKIDQKMGQIREFLRSEFSTFWLTEI